jgi:hypothetical protein
MIELLTEWQPIHRREEATLPILVHEESNLFAVPVDDDIPERPALRWSHAIRDRSANAGYVVRTVGTQHGEFCHLR